MQGLSLSFMGVVREHCDASLEEVQAAALSFPSEVVASFPIWLYLDLATGHAMLVKFSRAGPSHGGLFDPPESQLNLAS